MDPLFFELASDTAWEVGVGADMAGSVLTLLYHLLLCAALSMPAKPLMAIVLVGMPVALVVGVGLLALGRVGYGRWGGRGWGWNGPHRLRRLPLVVILFSFDHRSAYPTQKVTHPHD
jgi:hypothetical protein